MKVLGLPNPHEKVIAASHLQSSRPKALSFHLSERAPTQGPNSYASYACPPHDVDGYHIYCKKCLEVFSKSPH